MLTPENQTALRHALCDCRREALATFFSEFMVTLSSEGFSYEDLLQAITDWASEQPGMERVVNSLEEICALAQYVKEQQR